MLRLVEHYSDSVINLPYLKFKLFSLRETKGLNHVLRYRDVVCRVFLTGLPSNSNIEPYPHHIITNGNSIIRYISILKYGRVGIFKIFDIEIDSRGGVGD